jgi:hypothetical protein
MYNLFEATNAKNITERIGKLNADTKGQWGKMKVEQMLAHCAIALETPFAADTKQHFMGKVFGKMAKKSILSDQPFKKSSPTDKSFIVTNERHFENEKARLLKNINRFSGAGPNGIPNKKHPFFGDMTAAEWSTLMHKHLDHHLQQFGV